MHLRWHWVLQELGETTTARIVGEIATLNKSLIEGHGQNCALSGGLWEGRTILCLMCRPDRTARLE